MKGVRLEAGTRKRGLGPVRALMAWGDGLPVRLAFGAAWHCVHSASPLRPW